MFEITILAILQGVAEFLPISSSGHLVIAQSLLGVNEPGLLIDTALHLGTLLSIVLFYRQVIWRIVRNREWAYVLKIVVSALPAVAVYFTFREFVHGVFESTRAVGGFLVVTGLVLLATGKMKRGEKDVGFLRALIMGVGQAIAILPGISRSGMTIAFARAAKVDPEKSAEFSFLMSAPLILGAVMLQIVEIMRGGNAAVSEGVGWMPVLFGTALAAVVGYASLALLVRTLKGKRFWLFGVYCIAVGLIFCTMHHVVFASDCHGGDNEVILEDEALR